MMGIPTNRVSIDAEPTVAQRLVNSGYVSKTMTYINRTSRPIVVTEPTGVHVTIMPDSLSTPLMQFEIHVTYIARRGTANLEGLGDGLLTPVQYKIAARQLHETGEVTLKYMLSDVNLLLRGSVLVLNKLALAFSLEPFRLEGGLVQHNRIEPKDQLGVAIAVIQNDSAAPSRWIRFYSTMLEVSPTTSMLYDEGIYVFVHGGEGIEGRMLRFEFDDPLSPFKCFSSEEEARRYRWKDALPDIVQLRSKLQKLIEDGEAELTVRKNNLELENKRQLAEITMDKERLAQESRVQEALLKERSARRMDAYEERSVSRKSSSEALKIFPTILTLGAALIGLL